VTVTRWRRPPAREGEAQRNSRNDQREQLECQQTLAPKDPPASGALALTICSPGGSLAGGI
jgi:hypothetical protein